MRKVKYNDTYIYIDDTPISEEEIDIVPDNNLDNTEQIKIVDEQSLESNTNVDIFGDENNE